jgi:hypothetical protein
VTVTRRTIVVFFALAGHDLTKAFKLPSGSKILLALAVIIAVIGLVLATLPGRRWTCKQLIPGARSAAGSLRQAAASPVKLGLLFGGSALITLAYIAGLAASVQAFGGGPGLVVLGAVYLAAAALAAAAPTPGGLGDRGGAGRRADRRRHAGRARGLGRAAVPAGHLLAAGTTRLAVLAVPAAPGIRVTAGPRPAQRAPARVPVMPAGRRRLSAGAPVASSWLRAHGLISAGVTHVG